MVNDPIGDMLIRIKNALMVNQSVIRLPRSKAKLALAKILKKQGAITKIKKRDQELILNLAVKFSEFKRISKPGLRIYRSSKHLKPMSYGFQIISTSHGLMTETKAIKNKVGGEIICEIK